MYVCICIYNMYAYIIYKGDPDNLVIPSCLDVFHEPKAPNMGADLLEVNGTKDCDCACTN